MKESILFLCIGNSCRSQMAEGFARHFFNDRYEVYSAGLRKSVLDPIAIQVMQEINIDISKQVSKEVSSFNNLTFDWVITVCEEGAAECPYYKATKGNLYHAFEDPPKVTKQFSLSEKLKFYRSSRDEIGLFILTLPEIIRESRIKTAR